MRDSRDSRDMNQNMDDINEDRLMRIEEKVDKVVEHIGEINVTLARQNITLEEHVKRTNLLETKLEPVEKHVHMVSGVIKFLLLLSALAALIKLL